MALSRTQARKWFNDAERPDRSMRVTWHKERRFAVLSLWDGSTCTATFRLPVQDAAELSQLLVGFLGDCIRESPPPAPPPRSWIDRLRNRFRPALAEVI